MSGTIDQLNFEILIKDDKFNEKVKADLEVAKQLNVELTALLDMQSKVGKFKLATGSTAKSAAELARAKKAATDAAAAEERLAGAKSNRAAAEARAVKAATQAIAAQNKLTASLLGSTAAASKQGRIFNELKNMALSYLSIRGASQFIQSMVRITGEFELQKVALGSMLGDLNQAKLLIADIQQLALQSPFAFKELTSYAKQLAAFSVPANELYETTKMLADVSAGLGVGMDRIVLAYGQIRSAAFLRGQEVRQLTEAGIPILQELAKQFSEIEGRAVSAGEVFDKISARLVPFEMVAKVFKNMTSEGGKFYEMQEIQAETLKGKIANLKDAYEMMLNEIGTANDDRLKGAVDSLRELMLNWEKIGTILKTIIVIFGTYKAVLAAVAVYEKGLLVAQTYQRWARLTSYIKTTTGATVKFGAAMKVLGTTMKMVAGVGIAAIAGLVTLIISATRNSQRLNKELEKIGGEAADKVKNVSNDIERLVKNLNDATKGTQEYRDTISEINRKYGDYLPKIFSEADGYNEVALAARAAEQAIRNKARADAEAEGKAAIEKELGQDLRDAADDLFNSMILVGAGGISKKMARSIKEAFDTALLKEGAEDNIYQTFKEVADTFLGGEGKFLELYNNLLKVNSDAAQRLAERVVAYGEQSIKVRERMEDLQADLSDRFSATFETREEAIKVEEVEAEYRKLVAELKKVKQSQEQYDEQLRQLDIDKLEKLAKVYEDLNRPEIAKGYREQAKALKGLQEGWRGVINETLNGMGLKKGTAFGLWADEFTQSTKYVDDMLKRYQEIEKEMSLVGSFDDDKVKSLENEKKAIEGVAKALNISLRDLLESKGKTAAKEEPQELKDLKKQIDLVKKLKQSYGELREFLDDGQMKRILKSLFPEAEEEWLASLDFDAVLKKMADALDKYDEKAASNLRSSIGKDAAKDLSDLFEAFMKYKEAVDGWKAEDFNFYGGDEIGKILRDLSKEYESIEKKRRNTLELLRKAEAGDAEAIALLRTTLGEEVWKKYVTEGKKAIEELANAERTVAHKEAEDKAKEKASEILRKRMEEENIDLTDFADKSIAQVRTLLDRLTDIKNDIQAKIILLYRGGLTEDEKIRLAELTEELKLVGKQAEDTGEELDKKIGDALEKIASQTSKTFSNLGKEISEFGKLLDAPMLENLGEQFSEMASFAGDFAGKILSLSESLKGVEPGTAFKDLSENVKGGIFAVAATAALAFFKQIKNAITSYIQHQDLLNEKLYEYRDLMLELRREDFSNIFGTDEMALAAENARILTEAQERYNATLDKMNSKNSVNWLVWNKDWNKANTLIEMLEGISSNQGWNLYDNNGMIDIDALEMYYETFKRSLSRNQRKLVEELIENGKAYDDAAAQQAQYLTDLFSGVADSIADSMVEAFIESGNAAIDMGEIMSDVTKKMAVDMLKSIILERVFKNYQQDLEKIWANTEANSEERIKATSELLNNAKAEIEGLIPDFQQILEDIGLLQAGKDEARNDLGAGIKGITEDTANLLASYLNAIRADVSYARAIWERMDVSMQQIASALAGFSAPSLMEYQAQIASNTYNTMISTQSILSRLESVMDYRDGETSIRVV